MMHGSTKYGTKLQVLNGSKKSWPISYGNLLYKVGHDFLDSWNVIIFRYRFSHGTYIQW